MQKSRQSHSRQEGLDYLNLDCTAKIKETETMYYLCKHPHSLCEKDQERKEKEGGAWTDAGMLGYLIAAHKIFGLICFFQFATKLKPLSMTALPLSGNYSFN